MDSRNLIRQAINEEFPVAEKTLHYTLFEGTVKRYPGLALLVQSSGDPIALGSARALELSDAEKLRDFMEDKGISTLADHPKEVFLFHWTERAQGPMVFEVGYPVADDTEVPENDAGFLIRKLPPLKVFSIVYKGPFPFQEHTGWHRIEWERRAREKGCRYKETLYRELYHEYDWSDAHQHVTEIELEIE